jgi:protein-S-isoprenylcysteine O-methyltransferase Ste14
VGMMVNPAPNDKEAADRATKWVIALVIALVALFGVAIFAAVLVAALEPPGWLAATLAVGLVLGAVAFAWLVASALIKSRTSEETPRRIRSTNQP